jgi:sugar/nucleoside kinase (ribokinase family)
MDLLVVGDLNADLILSGGDVVPAFGQREQLIDDADLVLGGSGAIMAAGAARLGLDVAMVACVGDDALGRVMIETLGAAGVDTSGVIRDATASTGVSVGLVDGDDRAMLTAPGALAALTAAHVADELIGRARHVHVSSPFLQPGLAPGVGDLAARARSSSLDAGWDPAERWDVPIAAFDVVLPNAQEALALARRDDGDVEAAARAIAAQGPLAVVKLGPDGAIAATRDGELVRAAAPAVDAIEATGAGDSFDAGFLTAYVRGESLADALQLACACGALSTRRAGGTAAQPTLEEARALR